MISRTQILNRLTPFQNRRDILLHDQDVADIITGLLGTHRQYTREYDKIAPYFVGRNNYETGRNIWDFLKNNVRYRVEPESAQMLKSPAAIVTPTISGRTNTSDCKNYSLFTGGILDAINRSGGRINWCYRFASYKMFDKVPQHVFCVINPDTDNEIWIDAVLPTYNNKKQYYYKTDRKINNMALVALSGTMAGKKKKAKSTAQTKAQKKAANKEKRKKFFQKLKAQAKKAGKLILKYNPATVTARNAFLAVVKLNVRSLATNLKKLKDRGNTEVEKMWTGLGGNVSTLNIAIDQGSRKKRLGAISIKDRRFLTSSGSRVNLKPVKRPTMPMTSTVIDTFVPVPVAPAYPTGGGSYPGGYSGGGGYDGGGYDDAGIVEDQQEGSDFDMDNIDDDGNVVGIVITASTAAAIAAAAPIVAMVVKILGKNKISSPADDKGLIEDMTTAGEIEGQAALSDIEKEAEGIETATGTKILKGATEKATGGKFPVMPVVLIGGGLLAFTLLKKRK